MTAQRVLSNLTTNLITSYITIYSILQFYNSSIVHEHARYQKTQTMTIVQYLHIFNSTILQFFDSTRTCTLPKTQTMTIDQYFHLFNSTIQRFYIKTHITKKRKLWSLTTTSVYSIIWFYMKTHVTKKKLKL